jgi:isoquinoline 1-oxidoreductase beta subunit
MKSTRRAFLRETGSTAVGLAIAVHIPGLLKAGDEAAVFEPNAYIRIASNNTITLWVTRSEMGQGVRTNLPAVLAEELEVDLAQVKLEQAMPGIRFKGIRLRTSGSGSSAGTYMALRKAGATAREMLISAAASSWGVDSATCRAENGVVIQTASGKRRTYGELVALAARQPVPANPHLKDAKDFRIVGKPLKRADGPAIVRGRAIYGLDARPAAALTAVIARCPYLGGRLASFDAKKALAISGVRHVLPVKSGIAGGLAVVADNTWTAMKGRDALSIQWDRGPNANFDSDHFMGSLRNSIDQEGFPVRRDGDAEKALNSAKSRLQADYEYPFQAHAPLETMNCIADVRANSCEVWVPTQTPDSAQENISKALGLSPDAITIHTTLSGGGFGRRLIVDYVDETVEISKAIGKPVQVLWTRTDDMRHGFFHPGSVERLTAGIGDGRVLAWLHKSVGPDLSVIHFPSEEDKEDPQFYAKNELPWGAFDNPYNVPAMKADFVPVNGPVPTGPWRAVFYPSRVFARESFVDEIAHALSKDPLQLRIELLQPGDVLKLGEQEIERGRMIRVLEAIREKSGWAKALPPNSNRLAGRGLAINIYAGDSYMAQVAEVSVARDLSDLHIERVFCVFDCGLAINPIGLEGQAESGITWGLSATLHGKIDFRNGSAVQGTYSDFRVMRMNEMPELEIHILPSDRAPTGFGEHPVVPVAPAVANAVFAATGRRVRRLPITTAEIAAAHKSETV